MMLSCIRGVELVSKLSNSVVVSRSRNGLQTRRLLSKGSLAGGFTREGLETYAKQLWGKKDQKEVEDDDDDENVVITDLYSTKLSLPCARWLEEHDDTSSEMANSYFGSKQFFLERIILTFILLPNKQHCRNFNHNESQTTTTTTLTTLPKTFHLHHHFLVWKVTSKTPLELICSWEIKTFKGLTMFGFCPRTRRLYHGNSISFHETILSQHSTIFHLLNQFHVFYAKQLLNGMATSLENKFTKHTQSNK